MEIILNEYGSKIRIKDKMFLVENQDKSKSFSPYKVDRIMISSKSSISGEVVDVCHKHNIDLLFLDAYNYPITRIWNNKFGSISTLRKKQIEFFKTGNSLNLVKEWHIEKIKKSITLFKGDKNLVNEMELIQNKIKKLSIENDLIEFRNKLFSLEGQASKLFFLKYNSTLPLKYRAKVREKRKTKTKINAMLNYGFGILYNLLEKYIIIAGMDPSYGIIHINNYGKVPFVYDLIEKYRYLIYKMVKEIVEFTEYQEDDFSIVENKLKLSDKVRKDIAEYFRKNFEKEILEMKKYVKSLAMHILKNE
ncbi:CRISPR-associated endonuclease Cas1 [Streptobacillus canis]|uniref:CRISPR-associated endonuclease Cas1 n=1 Tax=Streptobacillus canis TaxID=2678686 RepID=UPI0012E2BA6E|nr:CRISPR-associated endonuclease Cas1 [Streptobacillus canis]